MKKNNIIKFLRNIALFVFIAIICFMSFKYSIFEKDFRHIKCCNENNCAICIFIQCAKDFAKIFITINIFISILNLIKILVYLLIKNNNEIIKYSLIDLRVRLDE